MILGIGTDMVDIRRVERLYQRFGERFIARVLTPKERTYLSQKKDPAAHVARLAKYLAAKEAAFKSLGADRTHAIGWHDFEVGYTPAGQPILHLHGHALAFLRDWRSAHAPQAHLSLSDEPPYVLAFVVLEEKAE